MKRHTAATSCEGFLRRAPFVALTLALLTVGCSTWKLPAWFGDESSDAAEPTAVTAYYTGEADLKLYPEPRFSPAYIVALPLHQKVYRSKVERGFAYVQVEGGRQSGWIDNSKLLWRLPEAAAPAPPPVAPGAIEQAPASAVTAEPPPAPAEEPAQLPAPAEAHDAAPEQAQPDEPQSADPSIFSPF